MKFRTLLFISVLGLLSSCGGDDDSNLMEPDMIDPVVEIATTITSIFDITDFEAYLNISIVNPESLVITERGVVYGSSPAPLINDNRKVYD